MKINRDNKGSGATDWFSHQAAKFKPKTAYPDSRMKVWNKPETKNDDRILIVEESNASDSMIQRIIGKFRGD